MKLFGVKLNGILNSLGKIREIKFQKIY